MYNGRHYDRDAQNTRYKRCGIGNNLSNHLYMGVVQDTDKDLDAHRTDSSSLVFYAHHLVNEIYPGSKRSATQQYSQHRDFLRVYGAHRLPDVPVRDVQLRTDV